MMTLSLREERQLLPLLVKEAAIPEFLGGFLKTIKDKTSFLSKPFESFLGTVGIIVVGRISKILGFLALIGEYYGFGLSSIGKMIDTSLGFNTGKPKISLSDIKKTAKGVIDTIAKKIGLKEAEFKNEYLLSKRAGLGTFLGQIFRAKRLSFVSILYGFIRTFVKGLIAAGLIGGLASMTGQRPAPPVGGKSKSLTGKLQYYKNVSNNVEDTLIKFLNAEIANFSRAFEAQKGRPLKGSSELQKVLYNIEILNYGKNISDLNLRDAFIGPDVKTLAKKILPKVNYQPLASSSSTKKTKELLKLLNEVKKK